MKFPLKTSIAAIALFAAAPALADIINVPASTANGTLVHGTGVLQNDFDVVGNLGAGGSNIVHFTGDTTETANTSDLLQLQQGQGQADITGAEIASTPNPSDTYNLISGDIFLTNHTGMYYLEFALTGLGNGGSVDFWLTDDGGTIWPFLDMLLGNGDTHFAFQAINGQTITNLHYAADTPPGELTILKQVRIIAAPGAVPEPATWALMLVGFGAVGYTMRRRRKTIMPQVA